jgi:hypothetical protein
MDHALAQGRLRHKPRLGSRNFTQNLRRGIRGAAKSSFGGAPGLRIELPNENAAANKQQTNKAELAVFISFISYVLLK